MKKNTGRKGYLKRTVTALSAIILALSIPVTALADGDFAGDIIIRYTIVGYEYKVYEVLNVAVLNGKDTVFEVPENWKDFIQTSENAAKLLIDGEDGTYLVNSDASSEIKRAFAEEVLEYAKENGIDAEAAITAETGKVTFEYLPLGMYVIDTAGRARVTVMWDMGWESEIKESYKPEKEEKPTVDTGAEEEAKEAVPAQEEAVTEETDSKADALQEAEANTEEDTSIVDNTTPESSADGNSNNIVVIVVAAVVLVLAAAGFIFIKNRGK